MKLLIVEDEQEPIDVLHDALDASAEEIHVIFVRSRDAAFVSLDREVFDAVVCDLRIPTQDGALDAHTDHGLAVYGRVGEKCSGTPVIVFSAYGDENLIPRLLADAHKGDPFGVRDQHPMLEFFRKRDLPDCVKRLEAIAASLRELDEIEIAVGPTELRLGPLERRALRVFGRRHDGAVIRVTELGGGLTGARVLRLQVVNAAGGLVSQVVAKLANLVSIDDERDRYERFVAPSLPSGTYTPLVGIVHEGAANYGGLFYALALEYGDSLFRVLADDPPKAVRVVDALKQGLEPWRRQAPYVVELVGDIRRRLIGDDVLAQNPARPIFEQMAAAAHQEQRQVNVRRCTQHADLHGLNVLVGDDGRCVILDFGSVMQANPSLDPLTLELSLVFHPAAADLRGTWPTLESARNWTAVDSFCDGAPWPDFIRTCRAWAYEAAAGDREVHANAYSYALRQCQFSDTSKELASAIAESALDALAAP